MTVAGIPGKAGQRRWPAAAAAIAACIVVAVSPVMAAPWLPAADDEIVETLPRPADAVRANLRQLQAQVAADPGNLPLTFDLARRYVELGRTEADPRYDGHAEALLAPWWARPDASADVLVLRAVLRQRAHQFDAALADLDQVVSIDPNNVQAWLTRATVLQVLGDYAEAAASCERLPRSTPPMVVTVCKAQVMSLSGEADAAYRRLQRWVEAGAAADPGLQQWALVVLGEIAARRGDSTAAADHFRAALAIPRRNVYLLAAYADLLLDQGRAAEVRSLLADETRTDALLLRLAIAETRQGSADAERHRAMLADRFAASRQRADSRHRREEARFALELENRPQAALALALDNWSRQREPADLRIVLAAALAAGEPAAAAPAVRWLRDRTLQDAALQPLLAAIEERTGPGTGEGTGLGVGRATN